MTPGEREFGELIGKVEAIGEAIAELRRTNTKEHAANAQRFERLETSVRDALDGKADKTVVDKHSLQIDSLESTRDRFGGAKAFLTGALGAALTLFGILISHF